MFAAFALSQGIYVKLSIWDSLFNPWLNIDVVIFYYYYQAREVLNLYPFTTFQLRAI